MSDIQVGGYHQTPCSKCGEIYNPTVTFHVCKEKRKVSEQTVEEINAIQKQIFEESEKCDICGDVMDDYGCMGVVTGRHTAAVFKLSEAALKAGVEALGELKTYCAQNGYTFPRELHNSTSKACLMMQNCLGKQGYADNGGVSYTFEYTEEIDVHTAIDAVQYALEQKDQDKEAKEYIYQSEQDYYLVIPDEYHVHFKVDYAGGEDIKRIRGNNE